MEYEHRERAFRSGTRSQNEDGRSCAGASGTKVFENTFPPPDWEYIFDFAVDDHDIDVHDSVAPFERGSDAIESAGPTALNAATAEGIANPFAQDGFTRPDSPTDQASAHQQPWTLPWTLDIDLSHTGAASLADHPGFTSINDPTLPHFTEIADDLFDLHLPKFKLLTVYKSTYTGRRQKTPLFDMSQVLQVSQRCSTPRKINAYRPQAA
ncbi:hypothetical protein PRZ48_009584 [Zasmidium cellare]|uniref:Uncharacterized protein n=1 Tax=Zasmidium cellare TaxID=395010 RepID=A0ABR0EC49_ZASCE|nr:hypothetical protein PRZ48_009584 [Zasmidium cellare]